MVKKYVITLIGDGSVGKTALLFRFKDDKPPDGSFNATIFDEYIKDIEIEGEHLQIKLWDNAGQESLDFIRTRYYPESDVILVCFSVNNKDSFENVETMWVPELRKYNSKAPILLVGTKNDLPDDVKDVSIQKMAERIGAMDFFTCSALSGSRVEEVFYAAATVLLQKKKRRGCILL